MFRIQQGKGFHITFANGYTISVQFGPGNYCDHHGVWEFSEEGFRRCGEEGSRTAEIAVINPEGNFVRIEPNDSVRGWVSPDEVAAIIAMIATNPEACAYRPAAE